MAKQNLRVMVASEYPQTRDFLKEVIKEEGAFLVGQAPDVTRAVTLARNLRPDIALIDSNLPYSVGSDTVRLSRIGGLDTAQAISEMIPTTRAIVINNLTVQLLVEHSVNLEAMAFLSQERIEGNIALKLQELGFEVMLPEAPLFANVEVKPYPVPTQNRNQTTENTIFFGTAAILGGGFLTGTLILAPVGVALALGGLAVLAFGLLRKITARLRLKPR